MAFNLGAFAGGLVSGGLKTYTTLKEQERLDTAEARDKTRFEEEQRKIELQRQAEDIARKAAIPTTADQPGLNLKDVVSALPIGMTADAVSPRTDTTPEYRAKFEEVFGGLTDEQKALVLRQYGDTSTPGGAKLEESQVLFVELAPQRPFMRRSAMVTAPPSIRTPGLRTRWTSVQASWSGRAPGSGAARSSAPAR
jgi:hypothetical protein